MNKLNQIKESQNLIINTNWVQYIHSAIPNKPETLRWICRALMLIFGHCLTCTGLSGCCFLKNKLPRPVDDENILNYKLHGRCHCEVIEINYAALSYTADAYCSIDKFSKYIFSDKYLNNGKMKLFNELGFNLEDSYMLKTEYEKQAKYKYLSGQYTIGSLDMFGQNINLTIDLVSKFGKKVSFLSGWKVYPDGYIICNTPYGGKYEKI